MTVVDRVVARFARPKNGRFEQREVAGPEARIAPDASPDVLVEVSTLFAGLS